MKKLFLLAVIVVLGAVGFGAWYVFGGSTPSKPHLSPTATTDVAAGSGATPAGSWTVARGQNVYVGYRMTELFAGDTIHKPAVGRTPQVTGSMTIGSGPGSAFSVSAATVTGEMGSLTSDRSPRDNYIHTHAIESDRYPTATFTLTQPIALPAGVKPGQKVTVTASGNLTLHGVTKPVTAPLQTRWDGSTVEVAGSAPIVLADYDITPPDTGVVKVDDHGSFELQLTFRRAG